MGKENEVVYFIKTYYKKSKTMKQNIFGLTFLIDFNLNIKISEEELKNIFIKTGYDVEGGDVFIDFISPNACFVVNGLGYLT